jgi:hypothetical protein
MRAAPQCRRESRGPRPGGDRASVSIARAAQIVKSRRFEAPSESLADQNEIFPKRGENSAADDKI